MPTITHPELIGLALGAGLLGAGTLANAAYRWRRWRPGPDWAVTTARIEYAVPMTYSTPGGRGAMVTGPHVQYRYTVASREYRALLLGARMPRGRSARDPAAVARAFPTGYRFAVHYDPAAPERAVASGYADGSWPVLAGVGVGLLVLAGWLGVGAVASR